ncbi:MAG TPA: Mur ligase family protein [Candidatus Dojkabacteria bacterium]|nr:Mur ligase family protein [Candidatus Dojkabacteria bacterium]
MAILTAKEISNLDLDSFNRIHFLGIVAPFNHFCARILQSKGKKLSASDTNQTSEVSIYWQKSGVLLPDGQKAENITDDIELAVVVNGVTPDNPEFIEIIRRDIPTIYIQQLHGLLTNQLKRIAVAGTHGKTTTTSIITWMMSQTIGLPNFIVGDANDRIAGLEANNNLDLSQEYHVVEACEYKRQFLDRVPRPYMSVITHIDLDHTDYYKSQEDYNLAFAELINATTNAVIIDCAGKNESAIIKLIAKTDNIDALPHFEYGYEINLPQKLEKSKCDHLGSLINCEIENNIDMTNTDLKKVLIYDIDKIRKIFPQLQSNLYGRHNYENILRAIATGLAIGIGKEEILSAIATFQGVSSRFELIGYTALKTPIFKDFAHNPQKIKSCLQGAREAFTEHKIILAYQPHNHERTYTFKQELAESLTEANSIIIPNIYTSRESQQDMDLISAKEFYEYLKAQLSDRVENISFTDELLLKQQKSSNNPLPPYNKTAEKIFEIEKQYSEKGEHSIIIIASAGDLGEVIKLIKASN